MSLTTDQLVNMSFGYLRGADLLRYSAPQLLIKQFEIDVSCFQDGCNTAYSELISLISNKYELKTEFSKRGFTNASAIAGIENGKVSILTLTNTGTNYLTLPAVSIVGGGGSGAEVQPVIENGFITRIDVINGGEGYSSAPVVLITGGAGIDSREMVFVKIAAICSVRNILANQQNIAEWMLANFSWADKAILALRNAQRGMPSIQQANNNKVGSPAELIKSSFITRG